jgi:predicted acyltransferase
MYHAQIPPPNRVFDPTLPGLTWVDLVFPFFLFSLGAALPLALGRRLDKPGASKKAIGQALRRFGLLLFFALASWQLNPIRLQGWNPKAGAIVWWIGPLACVSFTLVLGRFPSSWPTGAVRVIRVGGWAMAAAMMVLVPMAFGKSFSWRVSDPILLVLANVALFGTLIMLLFRKVPHFRWSILILGLGLHAARQMPDNIVKSVTDLQPLDWLFGPGASGWINWAFQPRFLKYLFIVIPGMAAGDILVQYLRERQQELDQAAAGKHHGWIVMPWLARAILALILVITGVFLALHLSRHILLGAFVTAVLLACLVFLVRLLPQGGARQAVEKLVILGAAGVAAGFILEPYQGGAKKDYATLSYYGYGAGFAALNLAGFLTVEAFARLGPAMNLLAANGRNPMLAYVASAFLVQPVLRLTGLWEPLMKATATPWMGTGRAFLITLLAALAVAWLGRMRVVWRS